MDSPFPQRPLLLAMLGLSFLGTTGAHAQVPFRVKDISPGPAESYILRSGVDANGTLFFAASDGVHGLELWKSDGTEAGTILVKDIYPGGDTWGAYSSEPGYLTNLGGVVIFVASEAGFSQPNYQAIWRSDGTEAGTVLVRDIYELPGGGGCSSVACPGCGFGSPRYLHVFAGAVLFPAADSGGLNNPDCLSPFNTELWKSDGTEAGTVLVKNIYPDPFPASPNPSIPSNLVEIDGTLFFAATDVNGRELWKSDGTTQGTVLVKDCGFREF